MEDLDSLEECIAMQAARMADSYARLLRELTSATARRHVYLLALQSSIVARERYRDITGRFPTLSMRERIPYGWGHV
jgi:hypothetical protein